MSSQVTDSPDEKDDELEDVTPTCSDAHVLGVLDDISEKEPIDDWTNSAHAADSITDQSCKIGAELKKNKIVQTNSVKESYEKFREDESNGSSDVSSAVASPEYPESTSSDSPLNTLTEPGQDVARINQAIENVNFVDDGSSLEDLRQGKGFLPCRHIESPGSDDSDDNGRSMGGASRPHSLSFPLPLKSIQGRRSRSSELSQLVRDYQDSSMGMSRSLPQHGGMLSKNGELTEFTASDLQAMIMRSSPMSKTDSSSMGSRTSSVRSITSASSSTSMGTSFTTSGMSCSPTSLMQQSPDDIPPIDPHIILDLENQARCVAGNLDHLMGNLKSNLHKMSAITVGCLEAYSSSVAATCDSVDGSIKSMYALMAKCEELSKNMHPVYQLADQIKEIKRLMDRFEGQIDAQSSS